jgi:hypothetical protein
MLSEPSEGKIRPRVPWDIESRMNVLARTGRNLAGSQSLRGKLCWRGPAVIYYSAMQQCNCTHRNNWHMATARGLHYKRLHCYCWVRTNPHTGSNYWNVSPALNPDFAREFRMLVKHYCLIRNQLFTCIYYTWFFTTCLGFSKQSSGEYHKH